MKLLKNKKKFYLNILQTENSLLLEEASEELQQIARNSIDDNSSRYRYVC